MFWRFFFATTTFRRPIRFTRAFGNCPQGHGSPFRSDDVRRRQLPGPKVYWSVLAAAARAMEEPFAQGDAAALVELERISGQAIALQRISDVPLGAFLSGGVDSSAIVALMQAQSSRRVRTFTIGFTEAGYNEAEYAKAVARHLGTDHTELYVSPEEAQAVIPRLPAIYDEPFSDSSQIPTFLVAQHARQHVTVSLSGDAGDELFGGYDRYFLARDLTRKLMCMPRAMRRRLAHAIGACPPWLLSALLRPLGAVVPYFRVSQPSDKAYMAAEVLALDDSGSLYRRLVSHWKDPASLVLGAREPATLLDELLMRPGVASTFRAVDDDDGYAHLFARRHPGKGGSRSDGGELGNARAVPRSPTGGICPFVAAVDENP